MKSKYKSAIVTLKPVTMADGRTTYIPVRQNEERDATDLTPIDAMQMAQRQMSAQPVTEKLTGGYKDRAIGFSIKTWQVSLLFGVIAWLLARVGAGVPLFSVRALLVLALGAGVVWFAAFALDLLLSPAGVAWYKARRFWNYMDREQIERFDYWRNLRQD